MIEAVVSRLKAQVPALKNRVEQAAFLLELLRQGRVPQGTQAIVIPNGMQGGAADAGSGVFRQTFTETVAILLFADVRDRTGARILDTLRPTIQAVIEAIAGWAPGDEIGVFELRRGALVSMTGGRLVYQIDFSVTDQLRITP